MPDYNSVPHSSLSIVIPLFNEEENVVPLVEAIFDVLAEDPEFLELVLVDDGSHDRTASLVLKLAEYEPRIRLVSHQRNRGLGAAIRTGFAAAAGDLILYTDADLPFDFKLIPQLLAVASDHSIVIGYRANRGEGLRRWVLTKGYNLLCRLALRLRVRDINFACKLIPRSALRGMRLGSEGSFIDAEVPKARLFLSRISPDLLSSDTRSINSISPRGYHRYFVRNGQVCRSTRSDAL